MSHLYTRGNFANAFLQQLGAPVSKRNIRAMLAWMQAEGDAGRFNPLNTTKAWPGATDFNGVGVKNYQSFQDGVAATVETMNYGADRGLYGYRPIRYNLLNDRRSYKTLTAIERSQWGTGGLALRVLRTVPILALLYRHHRISQ